MAPNSERVQKIMAIPDDIVYFDLVPPEVHPVAHYSGFKQETITLKKGHVKAEGLRPIPVDVRGSLTA